MQWQIGCNLCPYSWRLYRVSDSPVGRAEWWVSGWNRFLQSICISKGRVGQYCLVILPNIYTGWWIKTRQRQLFSHCLPSICDIGPFLAPPLRTLSSIACDLFFTCFSPPSLFLSGMNQCVIPFVFWCAISLILSWCSISICVVIVYQ